MTLSHPAALPLTRPCVVPINAALVAEELFRGARPDDLIPICSLRPGRLSSQKGRPYIHSFFPLTAEEHGNAEEIVATTVELGHEKTYWMAVTLRPDACAELPVWECDAVSFRYTQEFVSQIHGLFIDLDVGRSPEDSKNEFDQQTAGKALEGALALVEDNIIPMPTITACSGRGRYLLYLFTEPLDATSGNVARWRVVVDAILERVRHLAPDVGACRTLNRLFKTPGSGGRIAYEMSDDGTGDMRRYDFDEIDAFLLNHPYASAETVEEVERIAYTPIGAAPKRRRTGNRSWVQNARPMIVRRDELHRLNEYRGGRWPEMRHKLMLYYATAQRRMIYEYFGNDPASTKIVKEIALRKTLRFNAKLADPLPEDEVKGIFDTMPRKPQRNETIAGELNITKEEMLACGLTSHIPKDVRKRQENEKISKRNAKDRRAWWLDYFVVNGMTVQCITKVMGKDQRTVKRYVKKIEEKLKREGKVIPKRGSLRGRGRRKKEDVSSFTCVGGST